mgnify:CR=1 FL=1
MPETSLCPFCGNEPMNISYHITCTTKGCPIHGIHVSVDNWQTRPVEQGLLNKLRELIDITIRKHYCDVCSHYNENTKNCDVGVPCVKYSKWTYKHIDLFW